jgi:hypothetical protein
VVNAVAGYFLNRNFTGAGIRSMWVQVKLLFWAPGASNLPLDGVRGDQAAG